jgi:hypothetical protein
MFPYDTCVGFATALNLVGRFAVLTGWQYADDLKKREAQSGTELQLEEFWATELVDDVVAGPVSRHERSLPPPGLLLLLIARLLSRCAREIQPAVIQIMRLS